MKPASPNVSFPEIECKIVEFWREHRTFEKSLKHRQDATPYLFYDGPPFATGTPHYGHLLAGTIKDIIPRYQTMKGYAVERRFGWDTHGLPIEMLTEQELGLTGRQDILDYGIDRFNEACRAGVMRFVKEWEQTTTRLGRWVDFVNDYKTMDTDYMESVWWVFKQLWDRDRIYEGSRVMPYSWRLATPLSNFEASANYQEVQDPAITITFPLRDEPETAVLAWTTTPWTLPSNVALCVGSDIEYVKIKLTSGEQYWLAKQRLATYFETNQYEVLECCQGQVLVGRTYQPLFDYYPAAAEQGAYRIIADNYVTTEDGTGIVHQSPAHGEDDHRVGKQNNLPMLDPVNAEGVFEEPVTDFQGMNVKEADQHIIRALKEKGRLIRHETITHSYPFCWRSETPLIYKAISAWYVKVEDLREQMLTNNNSIHWVPEHIKEGRFGNWLKDARDWNMSRNRFWGNPLPVWRCESCGAYECLGSRAELEAKAGHAVPDLHKHFVDELHWECDNCCGRMSRIPEVLDCWFESGAMPYAQLHYPFENKELFEQVFPANFIAEGIDQTRGWFYTLMVLSTSLFQKSPFKNCVVNGMILAEDGKKMSKHLNNYPDPLSVIDEYGADALRLYLINSPAVKADTLRFSEHGVKEIVRSVILPFWNVYSFFTTYADVDNFQPSVDLTGSQNILDRWIISRFQTLLTGIEREMSLYHLYTVVPVLLEFLEELTNWYVRRSRRRFWSNETADKQDGYNTLYYILLNFSKVLAPFLPLITEEIYRNLATLQSDQPESVHLNDYPVADDALMDPQLEEAMELIQTTVRLGRTLRTNSNLRVRQPLQAITVVTRNEQAAEILKTHGSHIQAELNVKTVLFSADESKLLNITAKPNFRVLGPRFGKKMGEVAKTLKQITLDDIAQLEQGGTITVLGEELSLADIEIVRIPTGQEQIETTGGVTVYYDTILTPKLIAEGHAREFINRVQKMRKDASLHVSDRIMVTYSTSDELTSALNQYAEYIKSETLTEKLVANSHSSLDGELIQEHNIDDLVITIAISRNH